MRVLIVDPPSEITLSEVSAPALIVRKAVVPDPSPRTIVPLVPSELLAPALPIDETKSVPAL